MKHSYYSLLFIAVLESGCEVKFRKDSQQNMVCEIIKNNKVVFSRSRIMGEEDNLVFDVLYGVMNEKLDFIGTNN